MASVTAAMTVAGRALDEHRRALMIANGEGLTKTYNRVHGGDRSPGIGRLLELHVVLDEAVAEAYGWGDLALEHGYYGTTQGVRFTISEAGQVDVTGWGINHTPGRLNGPQADRVNGPRSGRPNGPR